MILTIRTDKPEAEIGLYTKSTELAYRKWQAHRELSVAIHKVIKELLDSQNKSWDDVGGIIYFKGPGSFTGLRIGASFVNALAESNQIPIVCRSGEDWIADGLESLEKGESDRTALPEYGSDPHVTIQKN